MSARASELNTVGVSISQEKHQNSTLTNVLFLPLVKRVFTGVPVSGIWRKKPKMHPKPNKTKKNQKKPVETEQIRLTKRAEKTKVNCGEVSPDPHEH